MPLLYLTVVSSKPVICVSDGHSKNVGIFVYSKETRMNDICHMIALVSLAMRGSKSNSFQKFSEMVSVRHVPLTSSTSFVYSLVNLEMMVCNQNKLIFHKAK